MIRKILHIDLDAFFCSVEENNDPSLIGKPFAVGGRPDQRGVVASCSYAARMFGVRSAMPMAQAIKVCPGLLIVSGRHGNYGKISKLIMDYLKSLTPLFEQVSIDEAFVDLSDLPETGEDLARLIQNHIRDEYNLPCSIGVATNKLVAKIATDYGKASKRSKTAPSAITVVPPGTEADFLSPMPTIALWGVGPKTASRLAELGIHTIGELAAWPKEERSKYFGKYGDDLARHALGISESPVQSSHIIKSVSNETTFERDIKDIIVLHETLHRLSESVGNRLRKKNLSGYTIKLKLRWKDFTTITRQTTLFHPTNDDREIYQTVKELFDRSWKTGKLVRLLGVGVTQFSEGEKQLSFWDLNLKRDDHLLTAVDTVRDRFGKDSIVRGSELNNKFSLDKKVKN